MTYAITNEDFVMNLGGHTVRGLGSLRRLPIFRDEAGNEYVSLNGQQLTNLKYVPQDGTRRETVQRGQ